MRPRLKVLTTLAVLAALAACGSRGNRVAEAERLIDLLDVQPGIAIGEIGAGNGEMAVIFARAIGPNGTLYATEIDQSKRDDIAAAVRAEDLANVHVVEAGETSANLPAACCEIIYLRRVYHHFTDAAAINETIHRALQPGGRLALIDFEPRVLFGGHGVRAESLIADLEAAGLSIEQRIDDWAGDGYLVIARRD